MSTPNMIAAEEQETVQHIVERVPKGYKVDNTNKIHHERHTLICGVTRTFSHSLAGCRRLMNIRVHAA